MSWQGREGTTTERGYGWRWQKLRLLVLKRDGGFCVPCADAGRVRVATAVDHVIPKWRGGTDEQTNLQSICDDCHADKTAAEAAEGQGRKPKPTIGEDGWPIE